MKTKSYVSEAVCGMGSAFLSHPIRKQSAMSKRRQEATSSEGSPMAKPKQMNSVMAKSRPINLVRHNPVSVRKNPPQDLSNTANPENVENRCGTQAKIQTNILKCVRQENTHNADSWKQEDRDESSSSTCTRKLVREVKFQNMTESKKCLDRAATTQSKCEGDPTGAVAKREQQFVDLPPLNLQRKSVKVVLPEGRKIREQSMDAPVSKVIKQMIEAPMFS